MDIYDPHIAIFVVIGIAALMNLISSILNRYLVYTPEYISKRRKIDEFQKAYMAAKRRGDEKELKKLEKKRVAISKMQAELALHGLKPMIFTFVIFYALWWWLSNLYQNIGQFVLLPFPIPFLGAALNYFWWYLLTSIWLGLIIQRHIIPKV